jgi:transketolase
MGIRDAFGQFLVEEGGANPKLVVLDGDLSSSTRTNLFGQKYPDRFFNMGVAEQDMIGTAAGLALGGMVPIVSSFTIFLTGKPWEQIRQSVCFMNLNVKLVSSHAGINVGEDGGSHQCIEDIALMRVLPNMKVIVPADGIEARGAFRAALNHNGPVYIRGGRSKFPIVMAPDYEFQLGMAPCLREGGDAAIIACGLMVSKALEAARLLAKEGIAARVINMSSLKPLDEKAVVKAAGETGAVVTAEEHSMYGGLGSAVAQVLGQHQPVPLEVVAIQDRFGTSGKPDELLSHYGLTEKEIAAKVKQAISRKR